MKTVHKVLLASDFTQSCDRARDHATAIARHAHAELHLLHVQVLHASQYSWDSIPNLDEIQDAISASAKLQTDNYQKTIDHPVTTAIERDITAAPAILRYAEEQDIDIIVMGTHGRKGVSRLFLGSTAAEVVRRAPVPVLVAGPDHELDDGSYGSILTPVDFSQASRGALRQAARIAELHKADLIAVHVIDTYALPPYYTDELGESGREKAKELLEQMIAEENLPVEAKVVVTSGKPHDRIVELAKDFAVALIVMGTAGLSGIERFLLGSTTDRVLRDAPCAVLAYRGEELSEM